jgi:CRP-like cAMP-binding protein
MICYSEDRDRSIITPRPFPKRTFAEDMILFHKGSPAQCLYLIESGAVRIFALSDTGQEITLDVHGPGECFGETPVATDLVYGLVNIRTDGQYILCGTMIEKGDDFDIKVFQAGVDA